MLLLVRIGTTHVIVSLLEMLVGNNRKFAVIRPDAPNRVLAGWSGKSDGWIRAEHPLNGAGKWMLKLKFVNSHNSWKF